MGRWNAVNGTTHALPTSILACSKKLHSTAGLPVCIESVAAFTSRDYDTVIYDLEQLMPIEPFASGIYFAAEDCWCGVKWDGVQYRHDFQLIKDILDKQAKKKITRSRCKRTEQLVEAAVAMHVQAALGSGDQCIQIRIDMKKGIVTTQTKTTTRRTFIGREKIAV